MSYNPQEIACWTKQELDRLGFLGLAYAASVIFQRFSPDAVYPTTGGRLAIQKDVLRAFDEIAGTDAVWSQSGQLWRPREDHDPPSRRSIT